MTSEAFIDDKLNRKEVAEHFKNILLNTDLNVFSLVAPWGCGKTYFIQNLIKTMNGDSVNISDNISIQEQYMKAYPLKIKFINNFNSL